MKITHEIRDRTNPFYAPTRTARIRVDLNRARHRGMLDLNEYKQELYEVHNVHVYSVEWFYRGKQFGLRLGNLRSQCGSAVVHLSTTNTNPSGLHEDPWTFPGIMVLTRDREVPTGLWELMTEYFMHYQEAEAEYGPIDFPPTLTDVNRSTRVITRHILDEDDYVEPDEMRDYHLPYNDAADLNRVRWSISEANSQCKVTVLFSFFREDHGPSSRLLPFIYRRLRRYPNTPVAITTNYGRGYGSEGVVEALLKHYEEGTLRLPRGVQFHWGLGSNPNEYYHDISWVMFSKKRVARR